MGKSLDPKCRQCRRKGEKLFLKGEKCFSSKCPLVKRNYPPGLHGVKGKPRLTEYGEQLQEKQKAKRMYRLLETQFHNYFKKAIKQKGDTGENFLKLLELRFDNVIYRLGLAKSRDQARQLINHNHFLVNNKKVNIPSYQLREKDIIKIGEKSTKATIFQELIQSVKPDNIPNWLNWDPKELIIKIVSEPEVEKLKQSINTKKIIEFYSR